MMKKYLKWGFSILGIAAVSAIATTVAVSCTAKQDLTNAYNDVKDDTISAIDEQHANDIANDFVGNETNQQTFTTYLIQNNYFNYSNDSLTVGSAYSSSDTQTSYQNALTSGLRAFINANTNNKNFSGFDSKDSSKVSVNVETYTSNSITFKVVYNTATSNSSVTINF